MFARNNLIPTEVIFQESSFVGKPSLIIFEIYYF